MKVQYLEVSAEFEPRKSVENLLRDMIKQSWPYCSLDFNENSSPPPLLYLLSLCLPPPPLSCALISGLR